MLKFYNTYKELFNTEPVNILEIGSRDGNCIEELRLLSNAENVYVVEPHPISYKNIITKYPNFNTYPFAISDKIDVLDFNAIPYECGLGTVGTSSLLKKNREIYKSVGLSDERFDYENPENWIKVLSITGKQLLTLINKEIDMTKIDVEGLTFEVLDSFGEDIRKIKMMHIEVEHIQIWENQHTFNDIENLLSYYGFREVYYLPMYFSGQQGDSVWVRM